MHLVTDKEERLGKNGVEEIMSHDWFKGVEWAHLRHIDPPYEPIISSEVDTSNFDKYEEEDPWIPDPQTK